MLPNQREHITAIVYMVKICTYAFLYHRSKKARFHSKKFAKLSNRIFEKQSKTEAEQSLEQKVEDIQPPIHELKKRKVAIQLLTKQTLANISCVRAAKDVPVFATGAPLRPGAKCACDANISYTKDSFT
ncbi:hypothetical protein ACEQPO_29350 [Bacillus sp. SL00103]